MDGSLWTGIFLQERSCNGSVHQGKMVWGRERGMGNESLNSRDDGVNVSLGVGHERAIVMNAHLLVSSCKHIHVHLLSPGSWSERNSLIKDDGFATE